MALIDVKTLMTTMHTLELKSSINSIIPQSIQIYNGIIVVMTVGAVIAISSVMAQLAAITPMDLLIFWICVKGLETLPRG